MFTARDYSGIEAVLVGYFAAAPGYIRLAKIDVHSFYTAYALNSLDGRVSTSELPDVSWPDERLIPALADIKQRFKHERNQLYKHLIHGANFAQTPKGAAEKIFRETGIEYPVRTIARVMDVYFELFPEIKRWHNTLLLQRLWYNRFEEAGQYLRLQIHDEVFSEVPESLIDSVDAIKKEEM